MYYKETEEGAKFLFWHLGYIETTYPLISGIIAYIDLAYSLKLNESHTGAGWSWSILETLPQFFWI